MFDGAIDINIKEFDRALADYGLWSGRTEEDAANKQAKNIAFRTVQFLPKATRAKIMEIALAEWWPKLVAKTLSKSQGHYTVKEALRVSKKMLSSRAKSVSFMKSAFSKAGRQFGGRGGKDSLTKARGFGIKATVSKPVADVIAIYTTDRGAKDARKKDRIATKALQRAIVFVTADMKKYVERKQAEHAKKVSF